MLNITNSADYNLLNSKNIIIVPETFSHNYERLLCEKYSNDVTKDTEVLTFTRISDRIFAEIGGFANNYINNSGRILAMYNAINSVFSQLKVYNSNKIEIITKILATIDEFKMYKVTENELLKATEELEGVLKNKVLDLYYIYCAYNKITANDIQDPRQELEFLCENFHKCTIYDNVNVYFDKFDGFTPQQCAFLVELLKKNINVTITLDIKDYSEKLYDLSSTSRDTLEQLKKICKRYKFDVKSDLGTEKARKFGEITKNIFEYDEFHTKNDDIALHISTTLQNECLYVAGKIIEIVSKNEDIRYKDICVTARNFDEYSEQLKVAFERYDIPIFMSKKDDICKKPPIKFILSAINAILNRFKTQSVLEYLKSPMLEFDYVRVCMLEDYVYRWNIKNISLNTNFVANPSFQLRALNEKEQELLQKHNEFKNKMLEPLANLEDNFKKCEKGADFIEALYNFCEEIKLPLKIIHFDTDDLTLKQQYDQIWEIIVDSFDQFFEISGSQRMNLDDFSKLYQTLISSYQISEIPSSIDNVSAGGFERMVGEKCKILFIMGADADNLPMKAKENPILNDDDREMLDNLEVELSPFGNDLIIREFELITNIFNLSEEKIFMSFSEVTSNKNTPSSIFKRITEIIDGLEVSTDASIDYDFMYKSKKTALEQLALVKNKDEIKKINPQIVKNSTINLLKKQTIEKIYSKNISPSRIEVQTSCRFRYFMQYGLKVKTRKVVGFNQAENGNFIHYILEQVLDKVDYKNIDVSKSIDEFIEIYAKEYFSENLASDPKFAYILMNLKKNTHEIVKNIIDEVKASEFVPCDFELEIGENANVKPLKIGDFSIIGKVDRVDTYKENGKTYLRIIDYKSGVKKLDLSSVYYGINMQMFVYLLAIEQSGKYDKEVSSSGVLYVPTKMPKINLDMPENDVKIKNKVANNLKRSGLITNDKHIIDKMETNSPFLFLPVKYNSDKKQTISKSSTVASEMQFSDVKTFVKDKIVEISKEFMSGEVAPNPYIYDKRSPCDYCEFTSSCGFCTSYDTKTVIESMENDEFWKKISKRGEKND